MRECRKCGTAKGPDEFRAGRSSCLDCERSYMNVWRAQNRERLGAYQREYEIKTQRKSWLKTKYGITPEEYETKLAAQGGACSICGSGPSHGRRFLCVDHNHATGQVRGLLCHKCNAALGQLNDDIGLVEKALSYMKEWE